MFCAVSGASHAKDPNAEAAQKAASMAKAEQTLMSDVNRAGPELEKRLAEAVKVDGGLLLVRTEMGLSVLPVSAPCTTLQCGAGMVVTFGNSVTSSVDRDESTKDVEYQASSNDVRLVLTAMPIFDECDVLGPRLGKRLLALLGAIGR